MKVRLVERNQRAICHNEINANGLFSSVIKYPDRSTEPQNLSRRISRQYNLHIEDLCYEIDDLSILLNKYEMESVFFLRLVDLYRYPGPKHLRLETIEPLEPIRGNVFMEPDFGGELEDLDFEDTVDAIVRLDAGARRVSVEIPPIPKERRLAWVADTLAVVTDSSMTLLGFELFDVHVTDNTWTTE